MKISTVLASTATLVLFCGVCAAQRASAKLDDVPVYPLTAIAAFQTGGWSEIDPKEGPRIIKERVPQIVIFSTKDDESVFRFTKKIDGLISNHEWGKWCALVICHQNDPTPSELDWRKRTADLKLKARDNQLTTISVGLWKRFPDSLGTIRAHRRFDGFNGYNAAVLFRNRKRKTQYIELLDTEQLDDDTLERISNQLAGLIESLPDIQPVARPTEE